MRTVADATAKDPAALEEADRTWRRKRAEAGMPVYEGPGVDLAVDTMNVGGIITNRPPADLPRERPGRPDGTEPVSLGRISTKPHAPGAELT